MIPAANINHDNPYLLDSYAPIAAERTYTDLEVIGEIPRDFAGVFARNGPNPRFAPRGRYHWFDGDGMIHAAHFEDGKVTYRNRWIRTRGLAMEEEANGPLWSGLMEPTTDNPEGMPYKDTANTDLAVHNGELLALWYICGVPYRLDPRTLETLGTASFGRDKPLRISAHTKVDPKTGEMMFFDYGHKPPYMSYGVVDGSGQMVHYTPVELPGPRKPHDMAITENYSILMDMPVIQKAGAGGRWSVAFHRDMPTRFAVVPRHGTEVRWFEAEPCYIYHSVNAWEEDGSIVMIGCRTADPLPKADPSDGIWAKMMANLRLDARLHRWRFDLATGQTTEESLDERAAEFPMVNRDMLGQRTRFSYHQALAKTRTIAFDGVVKYDTDSGASEYYDYGPDCYGSESPFAPRTNPTSEDDGYVLSFVHNQRENRSELIVLDAKEITAGPLARVIFPERLPLGFHACFAPQSQLGAGS